MTDLDVRLRELTTELTVGPEPPDFDALHVIGAAPQPTREHHGGLLAVAAAVLVVLVLASVALVRAQSGGGERPPSPATEPSNPQIQDVLANERGTVEYPPALVESSAVVAQMYGTDDPVKFQSDDDGEPVFVARNDLVRMVTAQRARTDRLPYSEADMLAPAHDESGKFAGYVSNIGFLTPDVVTAPGFDLCSLEVDHQLEALQRARQRGQGPEGPLPTRAIIADSLGCD